MSLENTQRKKTAAPQVEKRLLLMGGQIHAAADLGSWCYGADGTLFHSTADHQEQLSVFLQIGSVLQAAQQDRDQRPHILEDPIGIHWISEWCTDIKLLLLLGPFLLKNVTTEALMKRLDGMPLTLQTKRQYLRVMESIPVMAHEQAEQYAALLHFTLYDEEFERDRIVLERTTAADERKVPQRAGNNDYARMAELESAMLEDLKSGSFDADVQRGKGYHGELQHFGLPDDLREAKDNLIIFCAMCARAVTEAGVSLDTAMLMENRYICRIERAQQLSDIEEILRSMYEEFLDHVKALQEDSGLSREIRRVREYISHHYAEPLELAKLAQQVGYSEYYLTRKFTRQTGEKLSDYILEIRISAAKRQLLTTQKDIQRISEELQFGSRSYFDRVFRNKVGVTPAQYRQRGIDRETQEEH